MSPGAETIEGAGRPEPGAGAHPHPVKPLYWSVRRELWESRSVWLAPAIVASLVVLGSLVGAISLARRLGELSLGDDDAATAAIHKPFSIAAMLLVITAFVVGISYCLDALHGERRDRSLWFWKSLPVSDRTVVLGKALIPFAVLPLYTLALIWVTQGVMISVGALALLPDGPSLALYFSHLPLRQMVLVLPYGLAALAIWHAPLYAWLLFASGWARRVPLLFALLPPVTLIVFEKIAFNTSHFARWLAYRLVTGVCVAFDFQPNGLLPSGCPVDLTPGRFFATPGVWVGLAGAALFLTAAVRLRRSRGPL